MSRISAFWGMPSDQGLQKPKKGCPEPGAERIGGLPGSRPVTGPRTPSVDTQGAAVSWFLQSPEHPAWRLAEEADGGGGSSSGHLSWQ